MLLVSDKRVPKCFAQFFWFLYATSTNIIIMTSLIYTGIVITNVMREFTRRQVVLILFP